MTSSAKDLWRRAASIQAIRKFFINHDYLEIETPNLISTPAPETHIDAIPAGNAFLHTSPELCMKRLLSYGHSRIFQICKCYREGERGKIHLPEFTMLEWYRTGADYMDIMDECEAMIAFVAQALGAGEVIEYLGGRIDLKRPWERVTLKSMFDQYATISVEEAIHLDRFDEIIVDEIEPRLKGPRPVFLYDYPQSLAAFARLSKDSKWAERFELYMGGLEIANAFSELTDAREQRIRFEKEIERRKKLGKKGYPIPEKFLEDLPNMSPAAGIALGIDRLIMLLCDKAEIDKVVTFIPEEL
ncbi:MAG: EF-P lysine aminoacylase GenX [Deltaproteobacteria bacterium]|nr:EF-P lysine aminoacylase GenX [Deltaproteobacteria bacterium]